jgi:penicillin V acylase-like amidase (Ntn superfamily)
MCTRFTVPYLNGVLVGRTMDFANMVGEKYKKFAAGELKFKNPTTNNNEDSNKVPVWARYSEKLTETFISDAANQYVSIEGLWLPETTYQGHNIAKEPTWPTYKVHALSFMNFLLSGGTGMRSASEIASTITSTIINQNKVLALPEDRLIEKLATIHFSITDWNKDSDNNYRTIIIEIGTGSQDGDNRDDKAQLALPYERRRGAVKIYDFTQTGYGVMTNSPIYQSHIDNLRSYIHLHQAANTEDATIAGIKLHMTGNGNNLVGMPGGPTPADRFVRAALQLNLALAHTGRGQSFEKAKETAASILNTVHVTEGVSSEKSAEGPKWDKTLWSVIKYLEGDKVQYLYRQDPYDAFVALA